MHEKITNSDLYQSIFESSLAGLIVVDQHGSMLIANMSAQRMFGYVEGELVQQDIHLIIPDWKFKAVATDMNEIVVGPNQFYGRDKNGVKFPIDIRIVPTVIKGQDVKVIYCKPADISVFESDRKFRTLISNVSGIVYRSKTDRPWNIEFISEACLNITGYSPAQFYDSSDISWDSLIHPDDLSRVLLEVKKGIADKEQYQLTYRIVTANKEIKWIWEQVSCIMDERGNVCGLEGFLQDITKGKEIEMALDKEKKMLRQYMDSSPTMFLVINKDHTVALVNKRTCEILGLEQESILNKNWFGNFIPTRDKKL